MVVPVEDRLLLELEVFSSRIEPDKSSTDYTRERGITTCSLPTPHPYTYISGGHAWVPPSQCGCHHPPPVINKLGSPTQVQSIHNTNRHSTREHVLNMHTFVVCPVHCSWLVDATVSVWSCDLHRRYVH